jgi:hypothetical protein
VTARAVPVALAAVLFFGGALVVVDSGRRRAASPFPAGSVFNETPEGLSLAFRYLRARAGRAESPTVSVLSERVRTGALPPRGVLFRVRPQRKPPLAPAGGSARKKKEAGGGRARPPRVLLTPTEREWVRGGGRLVLAVDSAYGPVDIDRRVGGGPVRKVFPVWPGVSDLEPSPRGLGGGLVEEAYAVFVRGAVPVVSRLEAGRGDVVLVAAPEWLENRRLGRAHDLRLLEALAGEGRPVLFDEWAHGLGEEKGLFELLLEWGFGPAFAVTVLAFATLLGRERRRLAAGEDEPGDERSDAVDLVDSLGQLYERALTRREAAALHLEGLRHAVAARTGLRGAALERRTRELLGGGLPAASRRAERTPSEFLRSLAAVNEGYRRLHDHAHARRSP